MNKRYVARLVTGLSLSSLCLLMTACGTTQTIKPTSQGPLNLAKYKTVLVSDFRDKVTPAGTEAKHQDSRDRMRTAGRTFADLIASEIRKAETFQEIVREGAPAVPRLVICGDITRYDKGDITFRRMIGLGAGGSYFEGTVEFTDAETGELIGKVTVDRSSFLAGGDYAATQTPETFMEEAARRIAAEIKKMRTGTAATKM